MNLASKINIANLKLKAGETDVDIAFDMLKEVVTHPASSVKAWMLQRKIKATSLYLLMW